jgi:integrase
MVYVFSDDAGVTPWRPDRVSRMFRRVADRAGAEGVRLHDLRHFVATTMLEDGEPLHEVAGQLGNTMKTTEEKYRHFMPGRGRDSVDRRAARLGG